MGAASKLSRRQFGALALAPLMPSALTGSDRKPPPVDIDSVSGHLAAMNKWRRERLLECSGTRRYTLEHGKSAPAEMVVKADYSYPDQKTFQILSEKNAGLLEDQIFRRLIHAETQAARCETRDITVIEPANYNFQVIGTETLDGRSAYIMAVKPKHKGRLMVDGKIWVDAEDTALARIEGEIDTASFWVRNSRIVQCFRRIGPYWLASSTESDANVRFLGDVHLHIEFLDYQVRPA
jgi:hypothetical protein